MTPTERYTMDYLTDKLKQLQKDKDRLDFIIRKGLVADSLLLHTKQKIDRLMEKEKGKDVP